MLRMTATAAVLVLLSGSAALAQASGPDAKPYPMQTQAKNASSQEKDACFRDVNRYCSDAVPEGDMQVLACLKDHRKKISKGCDKVLAEHGQ